MTQDKELLLKDLCARLPYGIKAKYYGPAEECECCDTIEGIYPMDDEVVIGQYGLSVDRIKPYLFPLSSMTEEQKEFIKNRFCYDWDIDEHPYSLWAYCIEIGDADELIDFFHKNHIDYRGFIPKGLALDATDKNIY
jgi:hypothetical protein